jgi:hypothetical protein
MLATRGKAASVVSRGGAAMAAVSVASVLLLAACGHNDSTASSTPTLKTSTTTAVATPPAQPSNADGQPVSTEAPTPGTSSAAERPQPVQPSVPPAGAPPVTAKDQAFIDEIKKHGLSPTPDVAIPTADFICQSKVQNLPDDQLATYVNAMVGSDPAFDPAKMPVEQAGKVYIDAANRTYCDK